MAHFFRFISTLFSAALIATLLAGPECFAADLVITEVGSNSFYTDAEGRTRLDVPVWFEIANTSGQPINLSSYRIRSSAANMAGAILPEKTFALPDQILPPGAYFMLRGRRQSIDAEDQDSFLPGPKIAYIGDGSGGFPYWRESGFIEILKAGATVDFMKFGDSTASPGRPQEWQGAPAPRLPYGLNLFGQSLARSRNNDDTNQQADWARRQFATPAGPNDVTCDDDDDKDGLPDCSEMPGSTFAGLPLHDWGARTSQRDIFVEVDYMVRDTAQGPSPLDDAGTIPQRAALERVRQAFLSRGMAVHFDAGKLFHPASGVSPQDFDLGGGGPVPFKNGLVFGNHPDMRNLANIYDYKRQFMDLARKQSFHYMVFGHTQNADGVASWSGRAELPGNDLIITLGAWGLTTGSPERRNLLVNFQAGTILHEFGHNLGLRHGGSDHEHYKPNYFSTMNYLYQIFGLPDPESPKAGDRFQLQRVTCNPLEDSSCRQEPACRQYVQSFRDLHISPLSDPSAFRIDYSDGSGADIDEIRIDETKGLGRPAGAPVDYDCNGSASATQLSLELDGTPGKQVIRDFDDWSNVNLFFQRLGEGDRSGLFVALERLRRENPRTVIRTSDQVQPIADDVQPLSVEVTPPASFFNSIREVPQ